MEFKPGESIDLSNLSLFGEVVEVNPEANLNDTPPPPPDSDYRATPELVTSDDGNFVKLGKPPKTGNGRPPLQLIGVDWSIQAEGYPFDGAKIRTWPSTRMQQNRTTEIDVLYRAYTGRAAIGLTEGQKVQAVIEYLQAGQPLVVETEWAAQVMAEETDENNNRTVLRKMERFPKDANGNYIPLVSMDQHPNAKLREELKGYEVRTQARIVNYKSA